MKSDMNKEEVNTKELLIDPKTWLAEKTGTLTPEIYNGMILYIVKVAGDKISYQDACIQIKEIVKYWESEE